MRVSAFVAGGSHRDLHHSIAGHWRERALADRLSRWGLPELGHPTSFFWRCREEYASADVLHLHNLHGDYLSIAALPLWGLGKPVVWTLHDFWALTGNCATPRDCTRWRCACGGCPLRGVYPMSRVDSSRFYRWLKPKLIAAARPLLVTPSNWLAERVRELPELARLPLHVIPNPVASNVFVPTADPHAHRRELGIEPAAPTVIVAGANWADPFKGVRDAVYALRQAAMHIKGLQALVIGQAAERLLGQAGLPGRAFPFLQDRRALAEAYACADVCLFPSRAENDPLTTLEAMACGTPPVAYDVGGVPEQIEHGKTGFVARDGHPGELAAGLIRLAQDPPRTRHMGIAARECIMRHRSVAAATAQYRSVYEHAIRAWCRRRGNADPCFKRSRVGRCVARHLGWEQCRSARSEPPATVADAAQLTGAR